MNSLRCLVESAQIHLNELKLKNSELRRANEMLRPTSIVFATEHDGQTKKWHCIIDIFRSQDPVVRSQ